MRAPLCLTLAAMACCCEPCTVQAPGVALMACSACEMLVHRLCSNSTASAAGTRICTACSEAAKSHALRRSHRSRMMSDKAAAASAFTVPDPNPLPAAGDADETNSSSVNITSRSCLQKARAVVALVMDNCGGHTVKELELTQAFDVHVLLLSPNCSNLDAGNG